MIIYKITNIINNKSYIGQTIKTLDKRMMEHKRNAFNYDIDYVIKVARGKMKQYKRYRCRYIDREGGDE